MNQEMNNYSTMNDGYQPVYAQDDPGEGSIGKGILGAFIGAVIGAIPWAILYMIGYVASLMGLLIAAFSYRFYDKFGGKRSKLKLVIIAIALVFGILLGQVMGYTGDFVKLYYKANISETGESLGDFVQYWWEHYLIYDQETALRREYDRKLAELSPLERSSDDIMTAEEFIDAYYDVEVDEMREDMQEEFMDNAMMGLVYSALGAIGLFIRMHKENKKRKQNTTA